MTWTSWTSEYPRRCLLEMSWVHPVWPPDSPRVPRGWTASASQRALSLSTPSLVQPGRSTWTEARIPVPRLVGQEWMYPYCSERAYTFPSLHRVLNSFDSTSKTLKYTLDITSLLHGDDPSLIFLIDPEKEGLGSVVEDSTALGPVTLHTSNSKVRVSTD